MPVSICLKQNCLYLPLLQIYSTFSNPIITLPQAIIITFLGYCSSLQANLLTVNLAFKLISEYVLLAGNSKLVKYLILA